MIARPAALRSPAAAIGRMTELVRAAGDDAPGAAALARLRAGAQHADAPWLPPTVGGALPPGVHDVGVGAFLVQAGGTPRREELLRPLALRLEALARRGVREIHVGGGITTDSSLPKDLDVLIDLRDARALGVRGRVHDMAHGVNWHVAELRHTTMNPGWGGARPTWLEYFQHDRQLRPRGIARVTLDIGTRARSGTFVRTG